MKLTIITEIELHEYEGTDETFTPQEIQEGLETFKDEILFRIEESIYETDVPECWRFKKVEVKYKEQG